MIMSPVTEIKQAALESGFHFAAIAPVDPSPLAHHLDIWLQQGHAQQMRWIPDRRMLLRDPRRVWPDAKSMLVVGLRYSLSSHYDAFLTDPSRGAISRYAWGRDYHKIMGKRLLALGKNLSSILRQPVNFRKFVDAGPLLERPLAARAIPGFIGKNTLLIHKAIGSSFFLGELLLDISLPPDPLQELEGCGKCNACMKNCPSGALGIPWKQATRNCLSYHTIEGGPIISHRIRPLQGNRIFGCDECQTICPFNRENDQDASPPDPAFVPDNINRVAPSLADVMRWSRDEYDALFAGSAVRRVSHEYFQRNAVVALGNWGSDEALEILAPLRDSPSEILRAHAAWAIGQCHSAENATNILAKWQQNEANPLVRLELQLATNTSGN